MSKTSKSEGQPAKVKKENNKLAETTVETKVEQATVKKSTAKKSAAEKATETEHKVTFVVRFHTNMGQSLYITGAHPLFGNDDTHKALPMRYLNEELWSATLDFKKSDIPAEGIVYNYLLRFTDGTESFDWGRDKILTAEMLTSEEVLIIDSWNFAGYFENTFYTEPFKQVLLKHNYTPVAPLPPKAFTHTFKVKSPLLVKGQTLFLLGSGTELGAWNEENALIMRRGEKEDFFTVNVDLSKTSFPVYYKYGAYDVENKKVLRYEDGNNRMLFDAFVKTKKTIVNDGFTVLPLSWKGAGAAIPVFSLRSAHSGGCGEFTDLKLMVDWVKQTGLKLIQILPVNDTTATHTWLDSYPYSAISAFALHPMYLNLWDASDAVNKHIIESVAGEFQRLNKLRSIFGKTSFLFFGAMR